MDIRRHLLTPFSNKSRDSFQAHYNFMLPKRRFWKPEKHFGQPVWALFQASFWRLLLENVLKKMVQNAFRVSKIFVWGAWTLIYKFEHPFDEISLSPKYSRVIDELGWGLTGTHQGLTGDSLGSGATRDYEMCNVNKAHCGEQKSRTFSPRIENTNNLNKKRREK